MRVYKKQKRMIQPNLWCIHKINPRIPIFEKNKRTKGQTTWITFIFVQAYVRRMITMTDIVIPNNFEFRRDYNHTVGNILSLLILDYTWSPKNNFIIFFLLFLQNHNNLQSYFTGLSRNNVNCFCYVLDKILFDPLSKLWHCLLFNEIIVFHFFSERRTAKFHIENVY